MRLIKGKLYRLKRDCSLFKDDYSFSTILEVNGLDEGALVLMIEPSHFMRRSSSHKVFLRILLVGLTWKLKILNLWRNNWRKQRI